MRLRLAALHGNLKHGPESSTAALLSAFTSGADLLGLDVRAAEDGTLFVCHDGEIDALPVAEVRDFDLGRNFQVAGGTAFPWRKSPAIARPQSVGAILDALPDGVEVLFRLAPSIANRSEAVAGLRALVERRRWSQRAWLLKGADSDARGWHRPERLVTLLAGTLLEDWLTDVEAGPQLAIVDARRALNRFGNRYEPVGARVAQDQRRLIVDLAATPELPARVSALRGFADFVSGPSSVELADAVRSWRTLENEAFQGTEESSRFRFGYAKSTVHAHVHQQDGVHVDIRDYDGRLVFGDEADALERKVSRLEERVHGALQDWPFYSGGGVGTAFPVDADFSTQIDFEWAPRVPGSDPDAAPVPVQASMLELAAVNVDPPTHRPGWRVDDGERVPNVPRSFRDKNSFFDPHGAPPFVGSERDESDGFRLNHNLGSGYDNNQYARPLGNGAANLAGTLRLDRRGAWFSAYFRDGENPDWVCLGSCRNDSMNRRVFLRAVAKRWRQEFADGRPGYEPIPSNAVVFRNFLIRILLPEED